MSACSLDLSFKMVDLVTYNSRSKFKGSYAIVSSFGSENSMLTGGTDWILRNSGSTDLLFKVTSFLSTARLT